MKGRKPTPIPVTHVLGGHIENGSIHIVLLVGGRSNGSRLVLRLGGAEEAQRIAQAIITLVEALGDLTEGEGK